MTKLTPGYMIIQVLPQKVGRKQVGGELRLAHTRRNVDDQPLFAPLDHILEQRGEFAVVSAFLEARIDPVREAQRAGAGVLDPVALLFLFQEVEKLHLLLDRHGWQRLENGVSLRRREKIRQLHRWQA